jgi:CBS domain-containing protein
MSSPAIVVGPEDSARRVAELCIANRITGLPVADADGAPLGVVSIVDFKCADANESALRQSAWRRIAVGGGPVTEDDLAALTRGLGNVRQLMASPAICVEEDAPIIDAAKLISEHRIKRVVVTRDGRIAGVVTRADLLRAFSGVRPEALPKVETLTSRTPPRTGQANGVASAVIPPAAADAIDVSADTFRNLVTTYQRAKDDLQQRAENELRQRQQAEMEELLRAPLLDTEWRALLTKAQHVAAQGGTECVLMRFPARLCEDRGRAINLPDPDWPLSLRGKPARLADRWRDELRPLGFKLTARIANFPDGLPGDVEMSLLWR